MNRGTPVDIDPSTLQASQAPPDPPGERVHAFGEPRALEATVNMIVLRPAAEMMIKAPATRDSFRRRLRSNVLDQLKRNHVRARVQARYGRLNVWFDVTDDEPREAVAERATGALSRVPGIGSLSLVEATAPAELDAIVEVGARHFAAAVAQKRYAVRCKRSGDHAFGSMDVERALGAALQGHGAKVDLSDPEVTVSVEIDGHRAVFFSGRMPGPGGLPLGTGGRALALFSGGYDSAVAAWQLMKRGVEVDFLYCRIGSEAAERRALRVAKRLTDDWGAGSRPDFHVVDFQAVVAGLKRDAAPDLWQVLLKRSMLRAAETVADGIEARLSSCAARRGGRAVGVDALVTGESVGQVSSQTLANLRSIDAAATRPVFRPLAGFDKLEIMRLAERIGTAQASAEVEEDCAITPGRTATASRPGPVAEAEAQVEDRALAQAVAGARSMALRAIDAADLEGRAEADARLALDALPEGAVLLDGRPEPLRSAWSAPGSEPVAFARLMAHPEELDRGVPYVLYCQFGSQSESVAEALRRAGIDARSFRGGAAALKKHLEVAAAASVGGRS